MKNHSLGDWSIGQTRKIYEYDADEYDKMRDKLEQEKLLELKTGPDGDPLDYDYDAKLEYRISAENNDLSALAEDDDFGDRDGDDF